MDFVEGVKGLYLKGGLLGKAMVLSVIWVVAIAITMTYYWMKGDLKKPQTKGKPDQRVGSVTESDAKKS